MEWMAWELLSTPRKRNFSAISQKKKSAPKMQCLSLSLASAFSFCEHNDTDAPSPRFIFSLIHRESPGSVSDCLYF